MQSYKILNPPPGCWSRSKKIYPFMHNAPKNFDWNSDPFLSKKYALAQFCLKDGTVTFSDLFPTSTRYPSNVHRATVIVKILELLGSAFHMPPIELILSLHDIYCGNLPFPVFTFAKQNHGIAFPDYLSVSPRRQTFFSLIKKKNEEIPWEKKIAKAFWRGTSTGPWLLREKWKHHPRPKLCLLSKKHADL